MNTYLLFMLSEIRKDKMKLIKDPQKRALILSLATLLMEPSMITRQSGIIRTPM